MPNLAPTLRLMLVTDDALVAGRDLLELALAAVRGGVTSIQLRLKKATPRDLAVEARRLLDHLEIPVLVNDRLDVALAVGAAGVHLGPADLPIAAARRIVPPGFLIGASVGSVSEAQLGEGADYWGVGPWRVTRTKADAGAALGATGLEEILAAAKEIPCVAIGGVRAEDVPAIRSLGAAGVAVVSGILGSADLEQAARSFRVPDEGPR